jgi:adenylate kinase
MKVVVTGQVGLDKKPFLARVVEMARAEGFDPAVANIGTMMYREAPDVAGGRILDLPLSRLNGLRRSVFKDVLALCQARRDVIVNTHATFRWSHGLFYAFDYDQMKLLDADLYVVLVDNVDRVHYRLARDGHNDHTLKDLMVWREEEMLATELLGQIVRGHGCFYIMSRGADDTGAAALARLMFQPALKKVYLSYPMTHLNAEGSPQAVAEIEDLRRQAKRHFTCFDPGDLEEKFLCKLALESAAAGVRSVEVGPPGEKATLEISQLVDILADIDGQIYARDFKLIDQSDMIVSLIPEVNGSPALSSGVERELQHAHEATKEVFVIWRPKAAPSPFVTETATRVFASAQEAMQFFHQAGYVPDKPAGSLFA